MSFFRIATTCLMLGLTVGPAPDSARGQDATRVILYIGDGVGASYWTAASLEADTLAVEQFRIMGLVDTQASNSKVTDSAAAGTAYSAGIRTYNGAIGVDADSNSVRTVLEVARDQGLSTGLVATSTVTHATPASFAAHVPSRGMYFEIARQMAEFGMDVLLGGGLRHFDRQTRPDSTDYVTVATGSGAFVTSPTGLDSVDLGTTDRLLGLFAVDAMPAARDRSPTLPRMTEAALEVLDRNSSGFFLMVEGSQPDWRGHDNTALHVIAAEMIDFDRAIGVGLDYQRRHPETLIVVVADHETGGLAIQTARDSVSLAQAAGDLQASVKRLEAVVPLVDGYGVTLVDSTIELLNRTRLHLRHLSSGTNGRVSSIARYTSGGHTGQMIPLFASGPGAERFGGIIRNDRVGQLLMEALKAP